MEASAQLGLTIGIIDHPTKVGNDEAEYSTSGSGAKEQVVDVVYFWTKAQPFTQKEEGGVTVAVTSDREGLLEYKRAWKSADKVSTSG